jgi:hypothetical protein
VVGLGLAGRVGVLVLLKKILKGLKPGGHVFVAVALVGIHLAR